MAVNSSSHVSSYDVFLSFRGTDTRYGFTGNLYKALTDKGIHTFIDNEELPRGEEISPTLVKAIHESMIAIIVLSKEYASSSFCLDELATIIHCKTKGLLVIPVFYKVDPSDVRHHKGSYGDALAKHQKRFKHNIERLQKWKEALHKVANLSGYHFNDRVEYEYKFIESIAASVYKKIKTPLHVADHPVGLESCVAEVMKLLDVGSNDVVHVVGIYGMGGVGKSTLARAVYNNLIYENFDGLCFLENVREESHKHGIQHLQSILIQKVLGNKNFNIASATDGALMIPRMLRQKKILLVVDDVDKDEQLKRIVGKTDWFGPGSRVIITTRDQGLLACHQVKTIYELKELDEKNALQLLTWNAFKNEKADPIYEKVLNRVVTYASGLPLALEVIGSNMFGKSIEDWESAIDYYERNSDKGIQGILELSFIALQDDLKSVFLDIACCLNGRSLTEVSALYDHEMKYPIELLVQKSLIKFNEGDSVNMHDLIQDMGRQIDLRESHKKPRKRKRLWWWKDIIEVLKHNKGTSKIEIIYLDVPISDREQIIEWDGNAFKEMINLKILIIRNAKFSQGPKCLPNSLKVLEWCELPDGCFTSSELNLSTKMFQNLTVLKCYGCKSLTQIPDMSDFLNLEKLSFGDCGNLVTVHESIGHLGKVKELCLWGCRNLVSFPPIHLTSLQLLHLAGTGIESFPEISGKMENLKTIELMATPIKEIPISFVNLVGLQSLCMSGSIVKLPSSILMMPELREFAGWYWKGMEWVKEEDNEKTMGSIVSSKFYYLSLRGSKLDDDFFSISFTQLAHVRTLILAENNFTFLPECIKEFQSLRKLDVSDCKHLQEIRGVPPNIQYFDVSDCKHLQEIRGFPLNIKKFYARNCRSLSSSIVSMFINQELYEAGMEECHLPGAWIPEWFDHKSMRASTSFWFRNKLPNSILFLLIAPVNFHYVEPMVFINGKVLEFGDFTETKRMQMEMDHTYILELDGEFDLPKVALEREWNHVEITYANPEIEMTSIIRAMRMHVFNWESSKEDIRFSDPCRKRKLDDYLISFQSDINRLLKKCRFVDMEVSSEQLDQQQKCTVSCLTKWACSYFPTKFLVMGVLLCLVGICFQVVIVTYGKKNL